MVLALRSQFALPLLVKVSVVRSVLELELVELVVLELVLELAYQLELLLAYQLAY
jgi:hypothetical protein